MCGYYPNMTYAKAMANYCSYKTFCSDVRRLVLSVVILAGVAAYMSNCSLVLFK